MAGQSVQRTRWRTRVFFAKHLETPGLHTPLAGGPQVGEVPQQVGGWSLLPAVRALLRGQPGRSPPKLVSGAEGTEAA